MQATESYEHCEKRTTKIQDCLNQAFIHEIPIDEELQDDTGSPPKPSVECVQDEKHTVGIRRLQILLVKICEEILEQHAVKLRRKKTEEWVRSHFAYQDFDTDEQALKETNDFIREAHQVPHSTYCDPAEFWWMGVHRTFRI